jgi:hypothetical protein
MILLAAKSSPAESSDASEPPIQTLRWLTIAVAGVVLLLNLLFLTKNYYWDGVFFAQVIEDARGVNASLIHPSHLYDQLFVYLIYRSVALAGIHARVLTIFQITNCFLSAAAAAVFFRICIRLFTSVYVSIVLTVVFAFSATWWKFSADADAYILAVLLLLISFHFVVPGRQPRPFLVAIFHASAMLIHQLSIFFFPVAVIGILLQARRESHQSRLLDALKYSVAVAGITLLAYYATFRVVMGTPSLSRFVSWVTYFSPEHGFTFSLWGNFMYSVRSQLRVLLGGRVAFVRDFSNLWIYVLAVLTLALTLAFLLKTLRRIKDLKGTFGAAVKTYRNLILLCLAWIVPYVLFLFFFIPQNTFYRLLYLPPLVLLFGAWLSAAESRPNHKRRYRAALLAAAFFAANLTFSQYPYSQKRANPPLQLALKLNQAWPPGTTIYFGDFTGDNSLVKYFNPGTTWIETTPQALMRDYSKGGHEVWLDTTLMDRLAKTAEGKQWLGSHLITRPDYELVNSKYRIRFAQAKP